jgi:hypothetical protein
VIKGAWAIYHEAGKEELRNAGSWCIEHLSVEYGIFFFAIFNASIFKVS